MKLIDLLVQELPKRGGWPQEAKYYVQDRDGTTKASMDISRLSRYETTGIWSRGSASNKLNEYTFHAGVICSDNRYSIVSRYHYENAISSLNHPIWNGEGYPPVGAKCEHCPGGTMQHEWEIVTVLAINERPGGIFTDYWLMKEDGSSYVIGNPYRFRPICTETAQKRHELLCALEKLDIDSDITMKFFEAIAAGKIPHITLK